MSLSNGLEYRPRLRFPSYENDDCWQAKTLKEMGSFYNGLSGKCKDDFNHGDARFVTYRNVFSNTFASENQLEKIEIKPNEKQNKISYGDVIFTQSSETFGELGLSSVWLHTFQPYLNSFCIGWHPNEITSYSPKFMGYLLRTETVRKQIIIQGQGISRINLSANRIENIKLYFPNYSEQLKIAELMSLIDQKIEKQQQLVELLKKYKKGVMSSHFTKIEHDKTATKILLANDCLFFSGGTPKSTDKNFYEGEIPFIRSGEIHKNKTELFINEFALKNSSAKMVKKGDLLLAMYGATSGEVSISQINGAINQAILCIRPRNINTYYLKNILEYNKNQIITTYIQGGQGNLSAEIIKNLSFKIPTEKEQNIFNSYISQIDIIIEKNSKEIELIRKYKKGLLQQLFI